MTRGRLTKVRGTVISDTMTKTIVVRTEWKVKHPLYGKYIKRSTKYYAHDEKGEAHLGDIVDLAATRPLSKLKRWRLVRVVTHGAPVVDELGVSGETGREVKG